MTDPYKALGVRAGASAAAIREAYRVRRDRGSAAQQRAAAEAYAILATRGSVPSTTVVMSSAWVPAAM